MAHHEHWDGTGYPKGLQGSEIPLEARIVALADAYDAMMTDRPHRRALLAEEARAEIHRLAGQVFDPELAAQFLAMIENTERNGS